MNHHYAITVKKTRGLKRVIDYEDWLQQNTKKGYRFSNVNYEDTRGLHIHAIISSHEPVQYDNLKTCPHGWNFKLVPIYYQKGWLAYSQKDMEKDIKRQHQLTELWSEAPYPHNLSTWEATGPPRGEELYDPASDDEQSYKLRCRLKRCRLL